MPKRRAPPRHEVVFVEALCLYLRTVFHLTWENTLNRLATLSVAAIAALSLSACTGGSTPGVSSSAPASSGAAAPASSTAATSAAPTSASSPAAAESASESAPASSSAAAGAASGQPVALADPTIKDDVMRESFTATQLLRNFPRLEGRDEGREIVLLKLKVTSSAKYSGGVDCSAVKPLTKTHEETYESNGTTVYDAAMAKAGYPVLERVSKGESAEGWCAYVVQNSEDTADGDWVLYHKRLAATINGGGTIEAKEFTVPLKLKG